MMCGSVVVAQDREQTWQFDATDGGRVEFEMDSGLAWATNGIVVRYSGITLLAREAKVNQTTGEAVARGNVRLEREGQSWQGDYIEYNFKSGELRAADFRTGQAPVFAKGDLLVGDGKAGVYVGSKGMVTTDDSEHAGYYIRSRRMVIIPGHYIEAWHAVLYIHGVPAFYFPYYRHNLKNQGNRWSVTPGYRSVDGPYLLTSYNWHWDERLSGSVHIDGRGKRGLGGGPDFNWNLPRYGEGYIKSYYINDREPGEDPFTDQPLDDNRYRLWFGHQALLNTNLTAKALVRYQSDPFITRDFFESEYRKNVQPKSFVEVNQRWSNYSLDVMAQPQVNDFFETVERLPDVKLTGFRQQIGDTPLYYENESSVGYFRRKFADSDTNSPYAAFRADSYHQVTLPQTYFNWLTITPRVGGRGTHYGEAHMEGGITDEENRGVFNTGAEVSTKASRLWRDAKSDFFEINGLRHIVRPSVNYVFVPRPSVRPRDLPQFDYTVPTTRLLPIEFPDYTAIDSIDANNVVRFGLENKLQTMRPRGLENVVWWALYGDWRLDPREDQRTFSDAYSDFDVRPFSWLTLSSETRYDVNERRLREANHTATLLPAADWSLRFGHRYLESLPGFGPESGNNTFFTSLYYQFSENWGARMTHHFEARDGTLEEQQYTLYRDFRSWTGALTFRVRERRDQATDYTVAVTFSLKAFPRFDVGDDADEPSKLLGY